MTTEILDLIDTRGITLTNKFQTRLSRTQSGASQSIGYGSGYWKIEVNLNKGYRVKHDSIFAFLNKMRGKYYTFGLKIPVYKDTKTSYTSFILVDGAGQSGSSLNVQGMLPSTLALQAGDYINIDGKDKTYIVTEDLISDASGNGVLHIAPNLVSSPNDNADIIYQDVIFTVRNANDDISLSLDLNQLADWTLTFEEAWTS